MGSEDAEFSAKAEKETLQEFNERVKFLGMQVKIYELGRIIVGFTPGGFTTEGEACHHPMKQKD